MSNTAKHTKGPWEYVTHPSCNTVKTLGEFAGGGGRQVCNVPKPNNPESTANARLIAAAPEMAEALLATRDTVLAAGGTTPGLDKLLKKAGVL